MIGGGLDTGWTFYTPYSTQSTHYNVVPTMLGVVIAGFSSLLTALNFVVTDALDAGSRADVVSAADLHLDDVRHEPDHSAGRAGAGDGGDLGHRREDRADRHFRSGARRRPAVIPAPVLVLFAPGRVHHDPAGHGHRQRSHSLLRPQEAVGLQVRGLFEPGDRFVRFFGVGPSHVRGRHLALFGAGVLQLKLPGCRAVGRQGVQLDGHALQGLRWPSRRRCSLRWASWRCSRPAV